MLNSMKSHSSVASRRVSEGKMNKILLLFWQYAKVYYFCKLFQRKLMLKDKKKASPHRHYHCFSFYNNLYIFFSYLFHSDVFEMWDNFHIAVS
jgi:hypothetical protein